MPTLTINIAGRGTPLSNGQTSSVGHMWFSLNDGLGNENNFGFAPNESHHGNPIAPGKIYEDDNNTYLSLDFTQTIEITQEQYDAMKEFGQNPPDFGFDMGYNGLTNSCVDFTWKAMKAGGLNPADYNGSIWPTTNRLWVPFFLDPSILFPCPNAVTPADRCISPAANTTYRQARTTASPLILDLDGDGVEVSQLAAGAATQILFDHDADGVRTGTAWAKADDGILALDRDGNGTIDSGRELFGNNTLLSSEQRAGDGHAALAELDSDGDGQITALDTLFSQLRVWRDLDQDGVSDDGELFALADLGITQIGLDKTAGSRTLADGTQLDGTGNFTIDGQTRNYTDAWFAENPFYRQFTDAIPLSDAARALPGMQGAARSAISRRPPPSTRASSPTSMPWPASPAPR